MEQIIMPCKGPVVAGLERLELLIAKDQPEYIPLRALISAEASGILLTRWTPDPEQRQAIAAGADIFLELMTFKQPVQPILLRVAHGLEKESVLNYLGLPKTGTASS